METSPDSLLWCGGGKEKPPRSAATRKTISSVPAPSLSQADPQLEGTESGASSIADHHPTPCSAGTKSKTKKQKQKNSWWKKKQIKRNVTPPHHPNKKRRQIGFSAFFVWGITELGPPGGGGGPDLSPAEPAPSFANWEAAKKETSSKAKEFNAVVWGGPSLWSYSTVRPLLPSFRALLPSRANSPRFGSPSSRS